MKTLVVGDLHGCMEEFTELLDMAGIVSGEDCVISLGDFVDRGPDSVAVLKYFMKTPGVKALKGNHERKHVRSSKGECSAAASQRITRYQIGEEHYPEILKWMEGLPTYLDLGEALLVHGYLEPGIRLQQQKETVLLGTLTAKKYLDEKYPGQWYEHYDGDKPVIVGHCDYSGKGVPFVYNNKIFGIDTDCCRGGALTGIVLPEFRIVSTKSRGNHWGKTKRDYAFLQSNSNSASVKWKRIEGLLEKAAEQENIPQKAAEKLAGLAKMLEDGKQSIGAIFDHVIRTHERLLAELHAEYRSFDSFPEKQKSKLYARMIGSSPMSSFLHLARKGELTEDKVRKKFKTLAECTEFAVEIGAVEKQPESILCEENLQPEDDDTE